MKYMNFMKRRQNESNRNRSLSREKREPWLRGKDTERERPLQKSGTFARKLNRSPESFNK